MTIQLSWVYLQEEESSHEFANHSDEVVAGSVGESLEERAGFGPEPVYGVD